MDTYSLLEKWLKRLSPNKDSFFLTNINTQKGEKIMKDLEWAKREVELACQKENPNRKDGEFDYDCACYESALKAFESLHGNDHSAFSISQADAIRFRWDPFRAIAILNRLISGRPLTPIEGTDDEWGPACHYGRHPYSSGVTTYQCNRRSSLFKEVYLDGTVKYYDNKYVICADIDKPGITYSFGLVSDIVHDMFPITMPYSPEKPIFVLCDCFLTDEANGDFNTVGVFSALKQNGVITEQTKFTKINKFFREVSEGEKGPWVEITKKEYYERKAKAITTRS